MGKHVAGQMRSLSFYRDTLVIHEDEKSRNQQRLRLFFLRVQVPGNTLTPCIFSVTFDSKTDSKTGRQQWIFMDRGRNSIGLWSGWKTPCDYYHIFAVRWTHKIAVKCFSHAQNPKAYRRVF